MHLTDDIQAVGVLAAEEERLRHRHRLQHLTTGGLHDWSIPELNHKLILEAREEIFNLQHAKALASLS
ncbi:hypothetical protein M405DRAFT_831502, partial [Rhizopogon salebrosus TDB-379]